jgi:hypothetical protein
MKEQDRRFYVYVMFRLNGTPCYVGKGSGKRHLNMRRRHNPHLLSIIRQSGGSLPTAIIRDGLTEDEAFDTERAFIKALGREIDGGILVNLTDGGDGTSGHTLNNEVRERLSAKTRAHFASKTDAERSAHLLMLVEARKAGGSKEAREKRSIALKGRPKTAAHVASVKEALANPIAKEKLSEARRKQWTDPEFKERVTASLKAAWEAPGYREQQSEKIRTTRGPSLSAENRKTWDDPEMREKRCAAMRAGWARKRAEKAAAQIELI